MESPDEKSPPVTATGDTENQTYFHPDEGSLTTEDRHRALPMKKWQRLKQYNSGMWNGPRRENRKARHRQDDLHRYDAIACQLELTTFQKERGRRVFDGLRNDKLGLAVEQVIFAVCVAVVNADCDGKRYWPHKNKRDNDELFEEFGTELGLSMKQQLSTLMKIKQRTEL